MALAVVRRARVRCGAIVEACGVLQMGPRLSNPKGVGIWAAIPPRGSSTMPHIAFSPRHELAAQVPTLSLA